MQTIAEQPDTKPTEFGCLTGEWCSIEQLGSLYNRGGKCPVTTVMPARSCAAGHPQCTACRCCPCCTTCGCHGCSRPGCPCHRPTWLPWPADDAAGPR